MSNNTKEKGHDAPKKTARHHAVLMLAFGTADTLDNIEPFIKNVLKGRREVTPEIVEEVTGRYELIGGHSPLYDITKEQAKKLEESLKDSGKDVKVYIGMKFWHPFIKDTITEMCEDGIEEAVVLIMAPQPTNASTGGYIADLEEAQKNTKGLPELKFVDPWHTNPLLIEAIIENMESQLKENNINVDDINDLHIIYTAHSLPIVSLDGDDYVDKLKETMEAITKALPENLKQCDHTLAFQSQGNNAGGRVPWVGPDAETIIFRAGDRGRKNVLIVPIGFVADHVETLYDIDILMKSRANKLKIGFSRSPSLNTSDKFISLLTELVEEKL